MALTTADIQAAYVTFFNRPADVEGLNYWSSYGGSVADLYATFAQSTEYKDVFSGLSQSAQVNTVYQNLFGRDAEAEGLNYWVGMLANGNITLANLALAVAAGAQSTDLDTFNNRKTAATAFTQELDTTAEILAYQGAGANAVAKEWLSGVTDTASLTAAVAPSVINAAVTEMTTAGNGQTVTLSKGLDALVGGNGNDTFIGSVAAANEELNTLSALDSIDGGAGIDTLKILTDGTAISLPTLKNVEVIEAQSSAALTIDTTAAAGLTNLNVTKVGAGAGLQATAGATTDVAVKLDAPVTVPLTVNGGKNVDVTLTGAGASGNLNNITIGTTTAAQGDVKVDVTTAAAVKGANITGAATTVTGGKTVSVSQKVGSSSGLVADGVTTTTHALNAVNVNANASTTTVTVVQDKTVAASAGAVAVAGVAETASVKFTALTANGTVTVSGLTFTASKAMTAAEVAQAFANLSAAALKPGAATSDTQGPGAAANGVFTGSLLAGWNSGAASGDTVVFTASKGGAMATDLVATGAAVTTITQGVDAVEAKAAVLGVTAGTVTIAGGAALKTVTVDGYSKLGSTVNGTANALENLSLSNGGAFTAAVGAATVNLSLENVWDTAAVAATKTTAAVAAIQAAVAVGSATTTTLNVKNTGNNAVTLTTPAATLNLSGSGMLTAAGSSLTNLKTLKVTETAGLNLGASALTNVESVDTTGTTGAVTVQIDGSKATYAGGAGVDTVTVTTAAVDKAINLGAGDDRLVLLNAAPVIKSGLVLEGGDGVDTLALAAAFAATASAGAAFEAQINGFEKLELSGATAGETVNLDNLDDINYVITNGGAGVKLDKMLANATVELKGAHSAAVEVVLKDATGTADVVNLVANAGTGANIGTVKVDKVETINITTTDTDPSPAAVSTNTLALNGDSIATVNVAGAGDLVLGLDALSVKVAAVNASAATGSLTLNLSAYNGASFVTVTGGAGKDVLTASAGANAKADVLIGGAGDDILTAGSNGAKLTGGEGNDLFVLNAASKEANTYSSILDFQAGDLLQLTGATTFGKLTAALNPTTAVFSDFVAAAMAQANGAAGAHDAVWFSFAGNSYVVLEQGTAATFTNGTDSIIELTGVANLDSASFNLTFQTVSL